MPVESEIRDAAGRGRPAPDAAAPDAAAPDAAAPDAAAPDAAATGLRAAVEGADGFWSGKLFEAGEIEALRGLVERRLLARVAQLAPAALERFRSLGLERYHEASHLIDHASVWPRHLRLFDEAGIALLRRSAGFRRLEAAFGPAEVSNEVEGAAPEIVWRIVRPGEAGDVGPLHADRWFWEINRWPVPPGRRPIKIWTLLAGEPGRCGLRVAPGSQRAGGWRYRVEHRHGLDKPVFDEAASGIETRLLDTPPGGSVVFDYALLHGGAVTAGDTTRVSVEFTAFVPE